MSGMIGSQSENDHKYHFEDKAEALLRSASYLFMGFTPLEIMEGACERNDR